MYKSSLTFSLFHQNILQVILLIYRLTENLTITNYRVHRHYFGENYYRQETAQQDLKLIHQKI